MANDADAYKGWTVQSQEHIPAPESVPGQVFTQAELPDVEKVKESGFDPEILHNLWVEPAPAKAATAKGKAEVSA